MCRCGTSGCGSVGFAVGFDDLKGISNLNDSMILYNLLTRSVPSFIYACCSSVSLLKGLLNKEQASCIVFHD